MVDPNPNQLATPGGQLRRQHRAQVGDVGGQSDVIVLAVKPQQMRDVAAALLPMLASARPLLLSIAAGIRGADLSRWLGGYGAIVRTMPNTPALIGQGITGMVAMAGVSAEQKTAADDIMKAVGATVWLDDEALIDPVTAVSGSGPAYVFYFIEAMQQAAQELGLVGGAGQAAGAGHLCRRGAACGAARRRKCRCCASASRRRAAPPMRR